MSAFGTKRTLIERTLMSAFDPKRTSTRVNTRAGLLATRRSAGDLRATANRSTLVESVSAKIQGPGLENEPRHFRGETRRVA